MRFADVKRKKRLAPLIRKKGIFINLNESTLTYFKDLALEEGKGNQSLIQDALQYFVDNKLKPKVHWE